MGKRFKFFGNAFYQVKSGGTICSSEPYITFMAFKYCIWFCFNSGKPFLSVYENILLTFREIPVQPVIGANINASVISRHRRLILFESNPSSWVTVDIMESFLKPIILHLFLSIRHLCLVHHHCFWELYPERPVPA